MEVPLGRSFLFFLIICHAEDTAPRPCELYLDCGKATLKKLQKQRQILPIDSWMHWQSETRLLPKYSVFNRSEQPMQILAFLVSTCTTSERAVKRLNWLRSSMTRWSKRQHYALSKAIKERMDRFIAKRIAFLTREREHWRRKPYLAIRLPEYLTNTPCKNEGLISNLLRKLTRYSTGADI